jgi:hypothetical protein
LKPRPDRGHMPRRKLTPRRGTVGGGRGGIRLVFVPTKNIA